MAKRPIEIIFNKKEGQKWYLLRIIILDLNTSLIVPNSRTRTGLPSPTLRNLLSSSNLLLTCRPCNELQILKRHSVSNTQVVKSQIDKLQGVII